ncbi:MAG: contractile injection system protein, VgrG/Pvc8 family [Burkholderiaceae bacterium]|jgi:prophage tail gpP-like protein|nr:contractile injection system protein, VgrG/Pvc8 family [Burkholderiaceae bacterium]
MPSDAGLRLLTGGRAYGGWKSVRVQRGIEQVAGAFQLSVSELWPGEYEARRIQPGESCELRVGDEPVMTGYVDAVEMTVDAAEHIVEAAGRDKTADLVDCSAIAGTGQWRGRRVEQVAADLAAPFGVGVITQADTGAALPTFSVQEGETAFEAIERAARLRGLLLVTDGRGALVITRAGSTLLQTRLVLAENILRARALLDMRDRFSQYVLKGQTPGTDTHHGAAAAQPKASALDSGVQRHRPLVVVSDAPDLGASLQERARWEAVVRAARSTQVQITVQGWAHAGGLWQPNTLVHVVAEPLRLDHQLLISSVEYVLDEGGSTTELRLTRPDAYTLPPAPAPAGAGPARAPRARPQANDDFWAMPSRPTAGGR